MRARLGLLLAPCLAITSLAAPARAEDDDEAKQVERVPAIYDRDPFATKKGYAQLFATAMLGDGLRFDNPYRLRTPLGSDAESVSRTASYADVGFGLTLENPLKLQHGATLRASFALEGIKQAVFTPSYLAWRRWSALAAHGRFGIPVVVTPDVTWGFEGALGGSWFFLGGVGLTAEIVGDWIYGAGTRDVRAASYPILSGQIGFVGTYEVLP